MRQESPPQDQLQAPANVPVQYTLDGELKQLQQAPTQSAQPGVLVGNLGEPILLQGVNLVGVSAGPAEDSTQVKIWTSLALTSDDRLFHRVVESLGSAISPDS